MTTVRIVLPVTASGLPQTEPMAFLVDTSVWSLAYRRDAQPDVPELEALRRALMGGDHVAITGSGLCPRRSAHSAAGLATEPGLKN